MATVLRTMEDLKNQFEEVCLSRFVLALDELVDTEEPLIEELTELRRVLRSFWLNKDGSYVDFDMKMAVAVSPQAYFPGPDVMTMEKLRLSCRIDAMDDVRNALLFYYGQTPEGKLELLQSPHAGKRVEEAVELLMQDVTLWLGIEEKPQFNEEETPA